MKRVRFEPIPCARRRYEIRFVSEFSLRRYVQLFVSVFEKFFSDLKSWHALLHRAADSRTGAIGGYHSITADGPLVFKQDFADLDVKANTSLIKNELNVWVFLRLIH